MGGEHVVTPIGPITHGSEPADAQVRVIESYVYCDADGAPLYRIQRTQPKGFYQDKYDNILSSWVSGAGVMRGVRRVPYRLPELIAADLIVVVEGERDAERAFSSSLTELLAEQTGLKVAATTNAQGAEKWEVGWGKQYFGGKKIVVLPDNDEPGQQHARQVAADLTGHAQVVVVLNLPGLPPKGDLSDWLDSGRTVEQAARLIIEALEQPEQCALQPIAPPAPAASQPRDDQPRRTQSQALVELAIEGAEFFHDDVGSAWADVQNDGHRETWPLRSGGFRDWLARAFYQIEGKSPGGQAQADALAVLQGLARFDGPERSVFVRIAHFGGKIYLDLADQQWRAVEIDATGWRVVAEPPVRFRRSRAALPLPEPVTGGNLSELRRFLNVGDSDWPKLVAWLVGAFGDFPYPILTLTGEQGTGKTTTARLIRSLTDPARASARSAPRDERDLAVCATNAWIASFDNLSSIPDWLSDALCRLSTGGGFSTRQLFTDAEEQIFDFRRPAILTAIGDLASRGDLLDRTLTVRLQSVSDEKRREETTLWSDFEAARPKLLGALLDAVSTALRNRNSVHLLKKPRMADFAVWAVAAELALGVPSGSVIAALFEARDEATAQALEASPIAAAVQRLMAEHTSWSGTASELMTALLTASGLEGNKPPRSWPQNPSYLGRELRRAAPALRSAAGIEVEERRIGKKGARQIFLDRKGNLPSVPSVLSAEKPEPSPQEDSDDSGRLTASAQADSKTRLADSKTSQADSSPQSAVSRPGSPESLPRKDFSVPADSTDSTDGKISPFSEGDDEDDEFSELFRGVL
ncbi:hypothetical protein [Gloeobacter kilaueensis]|nr:hypothetical protein [Gloeobacter kilaueensis]